MFLKPNLLLITIKEKIPWSKKLSKRIFHFDCEGALELLNDKKKNMVHDLLKQFLKFYIKSMPKKEVVQRLNDANIKLERSELELKQYKQSKIRIKKINTNPLIDDVIFKRDETYPGNHFYFYEFLYF